MADFTTISKNRLSWSAPATVPLRTPKFLNIGTGFNLLISATKKLVIQPGQGTTWDNFNKTR